MSRTLRPALAIVVLTGCSATPPTDAADPDLGAAANVLADGLVATLQVSPARVAPGGEFTVRVALTNTTSDSARVTLACPALAMLSLRTAAGAVVDGTASLPSGCLGVIATVRLGAGRDTTVQLRGRASALVGPSITWQPLGRGTYTLHAEPTPIAVNGRALRLPALTRRLVVE